MRFIHCSDIHLGNIYGNSDSRYKDYFSAFSYVINTALRKKVDFLIIAGDLFQRGNIPPSVLDDTIKVLEPLKEKNIPVIAIEGNHDLYQRRRDESWLEFLSRRGYLILLRPEWDYQSARISFFPYQEETCKGGYLTLGNLTIYGIGYWGSNTSEMLIKTISALPEKADIGIFHGGVWDEGFMDLGRVSSDDIAPLSDIFRYVALGHGHKRYEVPGNSASSFAHNPGALEIVNPEEGARKGSENGWFCLVDMEPSEPYVEYLPLPRRTFINEKILVDGANNNDEIFRLFSEYIDKKSQTIKPNENPILFLKIDGRISFNTFDLDLENLKQYAEERLNPSYMEISNSALFAGKIVNRDNKAMNIDEIYQNTIMDIISEQEDPLYKKNNQKILNLVYRIKEEILEKNNKNLDELVDLIHRERMKFDE
jgi:DNA repair protein SbcD/Mre11